MSVTPDQIVKSIEDAEEALRRHVMTVLQGEPDADNFVGELPPILFVRKELVEQWKVQMDSGDDVVFFDPNNQTNRTTFRMNGMWEGRYTTRNDARRAAWLVMSLFPVGEAVVEPFAFINPTSNPTISPEVIELDEDHELGSSGLTRIYVASISLDCVFNATEQTT